MSDKMDETREKRKYVKTETTSIMDEVRDIWSPRPSHEQTLESDGYGSIKPEFTNAQFIAFINKPMKQLASGELEVVLTVPFEFKDLAYELSNALCYPLSVDIQIWKVFSEAIKDDG